MSILLPPWPRTIPRIMRPIARLGHQPRVSRYDLSDLAALEHAHRIQKRAHGPQCSFLTGIPSEMIFANRADFNAVANTISETSLLGGLNLQPWIPSFFFGAQSFGKTLSLWARGVISTTSAPTIIFTIRLGTAAASLAGTIVGVSPTITTASGITNKLWEAYIDLTCYTPGIGSGNTTLSGAGWVTSPGGFASPYQYALEQATPDTATWTTTFDNSVAQFFNLSVTWGTANASNTITCKQLFLAGWN